MSSTLNKIENFEEYSLEKERLEAFAKANFRESHLRSFLKGFSWRLVGTSVTMMTTFVLTGKIETALKLGAIEFFGKIFLFYGHERLWEMVPKGTIRVLRAKYFGK